MDKAEEAYLKRLSKLGVIDQVDQICKVYLRSSPPYAKVAVWPLTAPGQVEDLTKDPIDTNFLTPVMLPMYHSEQPRHVQVSKEGYEDRVIEFKTVPGEQIEVHAQLYKLGLAKYEGIIRALSTPPHAEIKIEQLVGGTWKEYKPESKYTTPQNFYLPLGEYRLTFSKEHFESKTKNVKLEKKGAFHEVHVVLRKISEAPEFARVF